MPEKYKKTEDRKLFLSVFLMQEIQFVLSAIVSKLSGKYQEMKNLRNFNGFNSFKSTLKFCFRRFVMETWKMFFPSAFFFNPWSANLTIWPNTFKQFVGCYRRIVWVCLTISWGWLLKGSCDSECIRIDTKAQGKDSYNQSDTVNHFIFQWFSYDKENTSLSYPFSQIWRC